MWEEAVHRAHNFRSRNVRASMYGVAYHGPAGYVTLQESNYLSKPFRMGAMNDLGTAFRITEEENYAHRPKPMFLYPHKNKQCKFMEREVCSQGQHFDAYTLHCVWCPLLGTWESIFGVGCAQLTQALEKTVRPWASQSNIGARPGLWTTSTRPPGMWTAWRRSGPTLDKYGWASCTPSPGTCGSLSELGLSSRNWPPRREK